MKRALACFTVVLISCAPPPRVEPFDGGEVIQDAGTFDAGFFDAGTMVDAGAPCDETCAGCCLDGRCLPTAQQNEYVCGPNADRCRACSLAELCSARGCVPRSNPDGGFLGAVGSACLVDTDCGSDNLGQCISEFNIDQYSGWPGGYCTRSCVSTSCAAGSECYDSPPSKFCMASCDAGTDCRPGYMCAMQMCFPQQ
ncbi:MAG: hypothetical protein ACO1OB_20675 [Archangium sp.]